MRSKVVRLVVSLVLFAGATARANEATTGSFKVIVNPSVAGRSIPREVLTQVFLGTVVRWGNGSPIAAVDLSSTSPLRQAFSEQVLGMSLDEVKFHWLRKISNGQRPPIAKATDEDVIAFVSAQPGAVGYVSSTTPTPETVREVSLQ
jgi:ABC-type phosphate transport system substrate-binding protein